MSDAVYKLIELTGSSSQGQQAAIENAVAKASVSLHNIRWFQVMETRGHVENGKISHWQVVLKLGFTLDE
ncbi:MAG: dodecin [Gammaproteobacteria bacterium]|jgi:dodecin